MNGLWKSHYDYEVALRDNKVLWHDNNTSIFQVIAKEKKIVLRQQGENLIGHINENWNEIKWTDGDIWKKNLDVTLLLKVFGFYWSCLHQ